MPYFNNDPLNDGAIDLPQQNTTPAYSSAELLDKAELLFRRFGEAEISTAEALATLGLAAGYGENILAQLEGYNLIKTETDTLTMSSLTVRLLQDSWQQTSGADGLLLGPSETAQFIAG